MNIILPNDKKCPATLFFHFTGYGTISFLILLSDVSVMPR